MNLGFCFDYKAYLGSYPQSHCLVRSGEGGRLGVGREKFRGKGLGPQGSSREKFPHNLQQNFLTLMAVKETQRLLAEL